jgi:hypothetical protein
VTNVLRAFIETGSRSPLTFHERSFAHFERYEPATGSTDGVDRKSIVVTTGRCGQTCAFDGAAEPLLLASA